MTVEVTPHCSSRESPFEQWWLGLIETEDLARKFGDPTAVGSRTFEAYQGEFLGFLGPNGAGRTTAVSMLTRLIQRNYHPSQVRYVRRS
jgi:ABC-type multidrug transport system ATPase subunit